MKNTILLFFAITISLMSNSQTKQEIHWQDMAISLKKNIVTQPVQIGQFAIFQITDINKFLYKVTIEGSVFELETPVPTELQTLFRLTSQQREQEANTNKAEEAAGLIGGAIPPMENLMKQKEKELASLESERDGQLKRLAAIPNTGKSKEIDKASKIKDSLKLNEARIASEEAFLKLMKELIDECTRYFELSTIVATDIFLLKNSRSELISIAQVDESYANIVNKVSLVKRPSSTVKSNYMRMKELYKRLEILYSRAETAYAEFVVNNTDRKKISTSLEYIEEADELIDQELLVGLYTDVEYLFNELSNPNNFKVTSPPVQMDGDLVRFSVNIIPTPSKTLGAYKNPVVFNFEVPTKGGLKVDFSVGPIISFGKNARDEKFFLEEGVNKLDTVILRQRDNNNAISPSIGALMHFYPRTGKYNGWGGLFGVGAGFQTIEDIDLSIFAGLSYVIGKKQKLMLNTGVSYLRVDRLKDVEFVVDKEYSVNKIALANVTEKVFKPSFFLSISYNLSNRVEIK